MLALLLALLFFAPPVHASPIGLCDPVDGPRVEFTPEDREEVRRRIKHACEAPVSEGGLGASENLCAYYDVMVMRESRGRSSIRHKRGKDADGTPESGLGPMALSRRWHKDKWPGDDEDPAWCTPEASLITVHAITWRAWDRYHVESLLDVQAIFAGRWECFDDPRSGFHMCYAAPSSRTVSALCPGMKRRGFRCNATLKRSDLGRKVPLRARREFV